MASLQARHTRKCELGKPWTKFEDAKPEGGCSCAPTYYVFVRQGSKATPQRVGKNRKAAKQALAKIQVTEDDGSFRAPKNIAFRVWGPQWRESLKRKATTKDSYVSSIAYAVEAFGDKLVRHVSPDDIARLTTLMEERGLSDSTQAKHLRVLGACFNAAVKHRYAIENPVAGMPDGQRPTPSKKEAAYFTDDELPPLFAAVPEGVFRVVFEVALKTGMRLGELLALTWRDVDLSGAVIRVRRTYTDGHLGTPKNHEKRSVDVTPDVVDLLGAWWGECGRPGDDALVFPGETADGYLVGTTILRRELYPAMVRAGIPREGPTGEKRTFHSFRHTFARIALEHGSELTWLSRHLGHSSTMVTDKVYGHWGSEARKAQVERLARGAFPALGYTSVSAGVEPDAAAA